MAKQSRAAADVAVDGGKRFWQGSKGRWAGEQLLKALERGEEMGPKHLRTASPLRKDDWIHFDEALVEEAHIRLRGIGDLISAGLTRPVANSMGKTIFQYEKINDLNPAEISMDGRDRTENDQLDFELNNLPLPIIHKDFDLGLRHLAASRTRGEALDTTQTRVAGRLIAERLELMLFTGGPTFGGVPIYGYLTHPDRTEIDFATAGEVWTAAGKTGEEILADVLNMIQAAKDDRMYGPYQLYIPSGYEVAIEADFKANSDKSIRQRISEIDSLRGITVADQLTADHVVLVQMTPDVVVLVQGEPLQNVQWDVEGGFQINFKAFTIQVPLIRSDAQGRSGVVVMKTL